MTDAELAALGAIRVDDRTLRRIIKHHGRVRGLGLRVPHAHCYALPRADLARLVEADGLDRLPEQVAVIPVTDGALATWRAIFHARVHLALEDLVRREVLTAAAIRERIHGIGQVEFDEVRFVLRQEDLILAPDDAAATYIEFVAHYLELRHFAPRELEQTFPVLHGAVRVDATIALDLDAAALLAATRPPGAPAHPLAAGVAAAAPAPAEPVPAARFARELARRGAVAARARGNHARAAILAARAGDAAASRADLDELVARLGRALDRPTDGWAEALVPVARFAAGRRVRRLTSGARLLHDLQAACLAGEREATVIDVVGWATRLGRRRMVRPLPATREVRVARHLRAAARKLPRCELGGRADRERLAGALHAMVAGANQSVRAALRPVIEAALFEVHLRPRHLPEQVAQKKIVDELLDQAVAVGWLSLGNLRDAIAHNDLKLPDLRPTELVTGDQLLRADRLLAGSLEGVYRRGEIYLRFLQKVSSVLSANPLGRLLSLYVLLPMVGSFFLVEGAQHMVGPALVALGGAEPRIASAPSLVGVAVYLFFLLHVGWFRRINLVAARALGRAGRAVFIELPLRAWRLPGVPPLTRWVLVPAIPAGLAALVIPGPARWPVAVALAVATALVVNSSAVAERVSDWLVRSGRQLSRRILPGVVRYALRAFEWAIEMFERGIYRIDDVLRFRTGGSRLVTVIKGVVGTLWLAVAYVLRIYVNLLIEPTVNPIKHFPVVTVAAKLILPFLPMMTSAIADPTSRIVGPALGASIGAFTVLVLPGLAGFLAWELGGNWKLYRRTRREHLQAVSIGSHGETMVGFLKPGFHSGTVLKLHARLRRAVAKGDERARARHEEGLHHVEEAIWKFADRQMVTMLNEAPPFRAVDVAVHHVHVGSNRVRVELACPSVADAPATISFEQQSGWLVAGVPTPGWLGDLDAEQRHVFEVALAGFYKRAGVDLVREQLERVLAVDGVVPPYDIADAGLVVWPGPRFTTEVVHAVGGLFPSATLRGALFGREPIRWDRWATTWERLGFGMTVDPLCKGPSLLPGG